MKTTLIGATLFILTAAAVAFYPALNTSGSVVATTPLHTTQLIDPVHVAKPKIDVVFVLDTTGSMSGLIAAAKEKIWSIATSMASAQPVPQIRIGLVAYRDRGDAYVTRVVDLSSDLDTMYATLMQFAADGGG
ncbi:MAG: VWA domain-containing protein, partial [Proteobacteria bacterium]|nr:VWA domain-containing protein [Pseudomonadota bacterium]